MGHREGGIGTTELFWQKAGVGVGLCAWAGWVVRGGGDLGMGISLVCVLLLL